MRTLLPSFVLILTLLSACAEDPAPPEPAGFEAQAIAFLSDVQPLSFAQEVEFCGYFGLDAQGGFSATEPVRGTLDFCDLGPFPQDMTVLASYHTHAAFDAEADSEVPSTLDLRADIRDRIDGFIATPGGRVWRTDWRARNARQLCGPGCIRSDPRFQELFPVAPSYTLLALRWRQLGY